MAGSVWRYKYSRGFIPRLFRAFILGKRVNLICFSAEKQKQNKKKTPKREKVDRMCDPP